MLFVVHKDAPGLSVKGDWDPLGMRGTNSRDLILKDVHITGDDLLMPRGIFGKTLPNFPHLMATLSPTYMGLAQVVYDFTVEYLQGKTPGQPPIDRRMYATKRITVGRMYARLANMRALWWQAFSEAHGFPTKAEVMRMYAAQYNLMEGVQELADLAIRTCGGQSMLKTMALERMYHDCCCGALMLPYTSEIMEDYLGVLSLYDMDEIDDAPGDEGVARRCGQLERSALGWRGKGGHVTGPVAADPAAVWATLRDFCGLCHPAIATITAQSDRRGSLIRAFTVKGEAATCREQLTYFSHSDRTLAYSHLQGIAGVKRYDARVTVLAAEWGGSVVRWAADLTAPAGGAAAIAPGTTAVFKARIAALGGVGAPVAALQAPGVAKVSTLVIDDLPRLAPPRLVLSVTPDLGRDTLCLFLHGIGGGRVNLLAQLRAAGGVMRAAALDLRGYGDSTLGPRQSTVDDYCADILRVTQALGARRLVLCGLSYGAWIATSFAMRHPEMLAGLVLSGGCTGMSEAGPGEREAFRLSREVPLNAGQLPADFAPALVRVLAGPHTSAGARAELLATMAAVPAKTYRDALTCFTNPLERFDFARLTMPVLLMTGQHDRLAPPSEIAAVARRICDLAPLPDVQFEVIACAGHVCNVEAPGDYGQHLLTFLHRLPQ